MATVNLFYTNRRGAGCCEYNIEHAALYERLTSLRRSGVKEANAYYTDDEKRENRMGGIEVFLYADDRRVRYQVWCETAGAGN